MVGHDSVSGTLPLSKIALSGATSGFLTRALCQPFDVVKIRLQLQVEPVSNVSTAKYKSLVQTVSLICREEGVRALWKGHVPAQCLSIVYGSSQFWVFEVLSKRLNNHKVNDIYMPGINLVCGSIAGGLATLLSFPFDVVRTRMVAQSERHKIYKGVLNAFVQIYRTESSSVFFRGLLPTIIQVTPHAGVQFMTYKIFLEIYQNVTGIDLMVYSFYGSIISGSLAGLCAKTAVYPFDLARKRMQVQGFHRKEHDFGRPLVCGGMVDCFRKIYSGEGFAGMFKGLSPSLLKAVVTSALHFSTYELICSLI